MLSHHNVDITHPLWPLNNDNYSQRIVMRGRKGTPPPSCMVEGVLWGISLSSYDITHSAPPTAYIKVAGNQN